MNYTQKEKLEEIISILTKSSIVFMEYMRKFEPTWNNEDKEEAKIMLGEMVLLTQGFQKALNGDIKGEQLEAIFSLISNSKIVYEELFINVSQWLKQYEENKK